MATPAADMELPDSTGKTQKLYGVKSPYTLLVIWDPTCGHCKEVLPKLDTLYRTKWKDVRRTTCLPWQKKQMALKQTGQNFINQIQVE